MSTAAAEPTIVEKGSKYPPVDDIGQVTQLDDPMTFKDGQPWAAFKRLREEAPVHWHDELAPWEPGFWAITKHADVLEISKQPDLYSSALGGHMMTFGDPKDRDPQQMAALLGNMIAMDPPDHTIYRKMVTPSFTPKAIKAMEDLIRGRVGVILDELEDKLAGGEADFVKDVAERLPLWTLSELLGVPEEDRHLLIDWTDRLTGQYDPEVNASPEDVFVAFAQLFDYGRKTMEARRQNPTEDLMSVIANTKVEGANLPPSALDGFFLLMVIAGNETTRNTIAGGLLAMSENPDQWALLCQQPDLVPNAVEEMLRYVSPVIYFRRTATRDTELRGQKIAQGEKVVMWYGAANRDEDVFENGEAFDITRQNASSHLAFGAGQHFCLGSRLGQLQIRVMYEELIRRFPTLHVTGAPNRMLSNFICGIKHLPVGM